MWYQVRGTVSKERLNNAAGQEIVFEDAYGRIIRFIPKQQQASLVWNGTVEREPAMLIVSLCVNNTVIGFGS